ncbi:hypothetical protein GQ457_13G017980 [Hibiscus cannabinus]
MLLGMSRRKTDLASIRSKLASRGISSIIDVSCPLCGSVLESVFHLLFICKVSWLVWMKCAAFWGLSLVFPGDPSSFLLAWHEAGYSRPKESLWHIFPFAILWTIWLFRNDIIFANGRVDPPILFFLVRSRSALWFKARWVDSVLSVDSLIADPSIADISSSLNLRPLVVQYWQAPPVGFLKMNVDGAMLSNGSKGGIGGLIRDSCGVWLDKFSHPISIRSGASYFGRVVSYRSWVDVFLCERKFC